MKFVNLSASDILKIPADKPQLLFSNDLEKAKAEFRTLSMIWFPDRNDNPKASEVFIQIKNLYEAAKRYIGTSAWDSANTLTLTTTTGKVLQRSFHIKHKFELGDFYVSDVAVTYIVKREFKDLYDRAIKNIETLPLKDERIKAQIAPFMPVIEATFEICEGLVLVIKKTKDTLLLRDVLNHFGKIGPEHAAWIFERLINLCCYLHLIAKTTHNAFNPDTIFINPLFHGAYLLGGWWYAGVLNGPNLLGVPKYTGDYGFQRSNRPDPLVDLTLIRAITRELLGDVNGLNYLTKNSSIPKLLAEWLNQGSTGNAITDYTNWRAIRARSLNSTHFVTLPVTSDSLYPKAVNYRTP